MLNVHCYSYGENAICRLVAILNLCQKSHIHEWFKIINSKLYLFNHCQHTKMLKYTIFNTSIHHGKSKAILEIQTKYVVGLYWNCCCTMR